MRVPRLLDLFCGAGGCSAGYAEAGFYVAGVDLAPQPNYQWAFRQGDALAFVVEHMDEIRREYDVIHASPPCQNYLNLGAVNRKLGRDYDHPDLIAATRELLTETGLPYVIENVEDAAPELRGPVRICGTGLGLPIRRHRLFESSIPLEGVACDHRAFREKKYWTSWRPKGQHRLSTVVQVYGNSGGKHEWPAAMGIDWMTNDEMSEAVPPLYAEHVGRQVMACLNS